MSTAHRTIVLHRRPCGPLSDDCFRIEEREDREPGPGEVALDVEMLSIDPAIRSWMDDKPSYLPPIEVGAPIRSAVLGRVSASGGAGLEPGDRVVALGSWSERCVVRAQDVVRRIPRDEGTPLSWSLGVLGGTGLTAWFGLHEVGRPRAGETVLVSAAAGGVGSVVVQLAKLAGCEVVGVVSRSRKADWLESLGVRPLVRSADGVTTAQLRSACPGGVDVYFDSVGGPILDAALRRLNHHGRVVLCGAISTQDDAVRVGPRDYLQLLAKSARMEGFTTYDFADRWDEARASLVAHLDAGRLTVRETTLDGLERAPEALGMLFRGDHIGKLLVRVAGEITPAETR